MWRLAGSRLKLRVSRTGGAFARAAIEGHEVGEGCRAHGTGWTESLDFLPRELAARDFLLLGTSSVDCRDSRKWLFTPGTLRDRRMPCIVSMVVLKAVHGLGRICRGEPEKREVRVTLGLWI